MDEPHTAPKESFFKRFVRILKGNDCCFATTTTKESPTTEIPSTTEASKTIDNIAGDESNTKNEISAVLKIKSSAESNLWSAGNLLIYVVAALAVVIC